MIVTFNKIIELKLLILRLSILKRKLNQYLYPHPLYSANTSHLAAFR
jgi:hypothetical protein